MAPLGSPPCPRTSNMLQISRASSPSSSSPLRCFRGSLYFPHQPPPRSPFWHRLAFQGSQEVPPSPAVSPRAPRDARAVRRHPSRPRSAATAAAWLAAEIGHLPAAAGCPCLPAAPGCPPVTPGRAGGALRVPCPRGGGPRSRAPTGRDTPGLLLLPASQRRSGPAGSPAAPAAPARGQGSPCPPRVVPAPRQCPGAGRAAAPLPGLLGFWECPSELPVPRCARACSRHGRRVEMP